MNILNTILNTLQICGNAEGKSIALSVADGYKYVDGKRTEEISHKRVSAVFSDKSYEKMNVG